MGNNSSRGDNMKKDMMKVMGSMMAGMAMGFVAGMVKERMMGCCCDCKCIIDEL